MIYENLLKAGFDMTTDLIPIYPCQHYLMGGIKVDTYARTTVENLYACGECSCTGVHGNNRLASNSLLEAHVFSRRAAADINEKAKSASKAFAPHEFDTHENAPKIPHGYRTKIRHVMQSTYFVIPNVDGLMQGLEEVSDILEVLDSGDFEIDRDYVEARSLATVAHIILSEALSICSNSEEIPNMPIFEKPD
jgi:L-aspartate oxidase